MTRELLPLRWKLTPLEVNVANTEELLHWLWQHAINGDLLLAHAMDGVIWGRISNDVLFISHMMDPQISPPLRLETLQQLRLFNSEREVYLWSDGINWQAVYATEFPNDNEAVLRENHILWGTKGKALENNFTDLEDGSQGLRHIVPIDASHVNEMNARHCMHIHHYLNIDETSGVTHIIYSRLAGIEVVKHG